MKLFLHQWRQSLWQRITTTLEIDGCIQKESCTMESYCFPEHFWPSNWSRSTLFRAFFCPIIGFGRGLVASAFHGASSHAAERGKCPRHQCINVVETLVYSSLPIRKHKIYLILHQRRRNSSLLYSTQLNWTQTLNSYETASISTGLPVPETVQLVPVPVVTVEVVVVVPVPMALDAKVYLLCSSERYAQR